MAPPLKTAESLVRSINRDEMPTLPVVVDYFGATISNDAHMDILHGVYVGMVRHKFVTAELLHNCFLTNRLDELIRAKHVHAKSDYYRQLVDNRIQVGRTCLLPSRVTRLPITDDDHCPSCNAVGYFREGNKIAGPPDCEVCFKGLCKLCDMVLNDDKTGYICGACNRLSATAYSASASASASAYAS